VAVVSGEEITRAEVFRYIANLPENVRQMPIERLFRLGVDQVINTKIVEDKVEQADLSDNPDVQQQLEEARSQIARSVFLQQQVDERITDEKLRELYDAYAARMGDVPETHARHILVEEEETAKELIGQLEEGADFAELAEEHSTGPTAEKGGDLGWFAKGEMVPEFSEAAFNIEPGQIAGEPVKTQFGWHVIKVEDRRTRPVPAFEEVKPMLESQVRRQVLDDMLQEWRDEENIEVYDINGNPAGQEQESADGQAENPAP
jgi:peptidyl-prolyl cis-trans isomerase C